MKKAIALVAMIMLACATFAEDGDIAKVKGKGIGIDKIEALKDAYRDAIERAVGLYVDAEQMVENEELVKDQILTHSNAYIEKYKLIKEGTAENGLITVTILADVRKRALAQKIKGVMPKQTVSLSESSKDLHAEIVTDFKQKKDAVAILKNELDNLSPIKQMMKVTLGAEKPTVESIPEDDSLVRLWYPIKVEVDSNRYYNELVPRMKRIFDEIKASPSKRLDMTNNLACMNAYERYISEQFGTSRVRKAGVMTRSAEAREYLHQSLISYDPLRQDGLALNQEYKGVCFFDAQILGKEYIIRGIVNDHFSYTIADRTMRERIREKFCNQINDFTLPFFIDHSWNPIYTLKKGESLPEDSKFLVGIIERAKGQKFSGHLYEMPSECANEIVKWQEKTVGVWNCDENRDSTLAKTMYELSFVDETGDEVVGCTFAIYNMDVINFTCTMLETTQYDNDNDRYAGGLFLWNITPLVGGFAKSYVKWISVDIPKDDVARISDATISVEE